MDIPALPFSNLDKTVRIPLGSKYIQNPITLREYLRNKRLELHLLQKNVASILDVSEETITNWENGKTEPQIQYYPTLIQFLGFFPFEIDTATIGGQIKKYRYEHGLSQEQLAKQLQVDESTVFHYENNKHIPSPKILIQIKNILSLND